MEEKSIAMEMLEELKRSNKRWFIISIVELFMIISMIIGFFVYESQFEYTDETYTQTIEDIDSNSTATQNIN